MRKLMLLIVIICTSCSGTRKASKIKPHIADKPVSIPLAHYGAGSSIITYTGSGGFLIQQDSSAILIDPYFSNINPLPLILFKKLKTDTILIDDFFEKNFGSSKDVSGLIKAILIAHSHYDHLADVPSIYLRNCNVDSTEIIGSPTTNHILKNSEIDKDITLINSVNELNSENIQSKTYQWIYTRNNQMRILPIPTEHAPHFCRIKLLSSKRLTKDLSKFPTKVGRFPEGENYNFIIDILGDNEKIKLRIFSHAGAACDDDIGIPNDSILKEKEIDVLFLCVANFNQVDNYPEKVIQRLKPRLIIGNHWENFFRQYRKNTRKPATVPNTNVKRFIKNVKQQLELLNLKDATIFILPIPNTAIEIAY